MMPNVQSTKPNIITAALIAGGITAASNIAAYLIARAINVPMQVTLGPGSSELQSLPWFAVILASIIPAFAAAIALVVLRRFSPRADLILQVVTAVIVIASLGGPLRQPTDDATKFVLNLMHVLSGGIIAYGLTRPATRAS
jgi:Family of unknown function (DUF6069)